jgi:AhpD family alkylhydroperoxidase
MQTYPVKKKLCSPARAFGIVRKAIRALPVLKRAGDDNTLSLAFRERLMLAVTQVNNCPMCSFAHSRIALEAGIPDTDIAAMLAGEAGHVPKEELPAVLFAQHYADSRGNPSPETWRRICDEYGPKKALAVLSAIQVIMLGNAYGIPFGSLKGRITGKKEQIDSRSTLAYEIVMLSLLVVYIPAGCIAALFTRTASCPA